MRFLLLRRILVALLLLTFVGGSWLSAAAQEAPSPCMMAMDAGMPMGGDMAKQAPSDRSMPCEKGVPSCAKQFCCLAGAMLLTGAPASVTLTAYYRSLPAHGPAARRHVGRARTLPAHSQLIPIPPPLVSDGKPARAAARPRTVAVAC